MKTYFHREKNINIHGMWSYPQKPLQFHALGLCSVTSTGPFFIQEFCNSITNHPTGLEHGYNFFFTTHTHFPVWDGFAQQSASHLAFLSYRAISLYKRIMSETTDKHVTNKDHHTAAVNVTSSNIIHCTLHPKHECVALFNMGYIHKYDYSAPPDIIRFQWGCLR